MCAPLTLWVSIHTHATLGRIRGREAVYVTYFALLLYLNNVNFFPHPGKIISIDTSSLRAAGRTGWEDLVRKCIYAFFQPQGREPSYAKQLFQEGNRLLSSLCFALRIEVGWLQSEADASVRSNPCCWISAFWKNEYCKNNKVPKEVAEMAE